jgi:predicted DCC family thiol-disulfide oxidoreductase YuxK
LRFVSLKSEKIAGVLARHSLGGLDTSGGTMLVVRDAGGTAESVLVRSEAVVALLKELPRPWPWIGLLLKGIPRPLRDVGYRLVARWRYRIWGRLESCLVPTAEERERFL